MSSTLETQPVENCKSPHSIKGFHSWMRCEGDEQWCSLCGKDVSDIRHKEENSHGN